MTDAELLNLCVTAYHETINIWRLRNSISNTLSGAMAAIVYKDKIYFLSALRAPCDAVKLANVAKGSGRQFMDDALTAGVGRSSPVPAIGLHVNKGLRRLFQISTYLALFNGFLFNFRESLLITDLSIRVHAHGGRYAEINCS